MYAILEWGDETQIANGVGKSSSMMAKYLSPEDCHESPLFKAAAILAAWIDGNHQSGNEALRRFIGFVSRAIPGTDTTPEGLILAAVSKVETELADIRQHIPQIRLDMRREVERKQKEKK